MTKSTSIFRKIKKENKAEIPTFALILQKIQLQKPSSPEKRPKAEKNKKEEIKYKLKMKTRKVNCNKKSKQAPKPNHYFL